MSDMPENPVVAYRTSIGFLPKVAEELDALMKSERMTKTDICNRAITLYAFITARIEAGDHILVRNGETGEVERIRLI